MYDIQSSADFLPWSHRQTLWLNASQVFGGNALPKRYTPDRSGVDHRLPLPFFVVAFFFVLRIPVWLDLS
jgi:hypothetical protein